jgi:hypothetical protein
MDVNIGYQVQQKRVPNQMLDEVSAPAVGNQLKFLPIILVVSLLGLVGTGYFYFQYRSIQAQLSNPKEAVKADNKVLVAKVSRHILLPTSEDPQIVTISDKDKLSNQAFFQNAKNGDKVLIYNAAKKAILYDPVSDKILEVAPVNGSAAGPTPTISNTASVLATTSTPSNTEVKTQLKIGIYNGTNTSGQTAIVEKLLQDKGITFETVTKDNTKKKEYDSTYVVDISGKNKDEASKIAAAVAGSVASLPTGEESLTSSNGTLMDIIVIIGLNFVNSAPTAQATTAPPSSTPGALLVP